MQPMPQQKMNAPKKEDPPKKDEEEQKKRPIPKFEREELKKIASEEKTQKVIEFVLYRFDLKPQCQEEFIIVHQCGNLALVDQLFFGFTQFFKRSLCSYALFLNNENLNVKF